MCQLTGTSLVQGVASVVPPIRNNHVDTTVKYYTWVRIITVIPIYGHIVPISPWVKICTIKYSNGFVAFCFVVVISSVQSEFLWFIYPSTLPLFTQRQDVLPSNLEKSRSRELTVMMVVSLWKLTGAAADIPFKFQSNLKSLNLTASILHEILR